MRKGKQGNKGITLIALIVTVIVLLILAGITIGALTGDNGIIKEARSSKESAEKATLEEQVEAAIIIAEQKYRNPTLAQVIEEIMKIETVKSVDSDTGNVVSTLGYVIEGKLEDYLPLYNTASMIESAKKQNKPFENKAEIQDTFGNKVVVPEGFKIANDSGNNVTEGVVIEDVSYGESAGSQFVWIPVGTVYKNDSKTETEIITLGRYSFDDTTGEPTDYSGAYKEDNTKNIEDFKTSVNTNHGYYIGRYEARVAEQRIEGTDNIEELKKVTIKANDFVYNFITQPQAVQLSQEMYENNEITSYLINSYAWDTAIVFLQKFDDRANKTKPYSIDKSIGLASYEDYRKGSNNLTRVELQDKICNVWDMATGGGREYTTERSSTSYITRGWPQWQGGYGILVRGSSWRKTTSGVSSSNITFRVIIY